MNDRPNVRLARRTLGLALVLGAGVALWAWLRAEEARTEEAQTPVERFRQLGAA